MKILNLALFATVLLLTACSSVPIPEQRPTNEGIFTTPPAKSRLSTIPTGPNVSAGLVLTKNTLNGVDYLQKSYERVVNSSSAVDRRLIESGKIVRDPDFIIRWVMKSLGQKFGTVVVHDNISSADSAKPDILVVLDSTFLMIDADNDTVKAYIKIDFYDAHKAFIGHATGKRERKFNLWASRTIETALQWDIDQKNVLIGALTDLDKAIDMLATSPNLPASTQADAFDKCVKNISYLDDLEKRMAALNGCKK